ncbi:MAG: hypothetical protein HOW71_44925 [Nonomuraea sp.]|nr:hypothetical protein [Nonomuraea sp.]NUQ95878.1 hypothetical protein [Streptomyces sp.]NUS15508.1 hypothetical protein [Streptomyces sp.]NUS24033.1 hypothetical protein [Streptomyces sp.]
MAKLVKAVHVKDPDRNRMVLLLPGEEPEPRLAALITNPDAWEDGVVPAAATGSSDDTGDGAGDGDGASEDSGKHAGDVEDAPKAAPAAKKTAARKTAAHKPARGRDAAEKGDSGA